MTKVALEVVPIVLGAVGTGFLFWEVREAQKSERWSQEAAVRTREMSRLMELSALFRADMREFWIRSAMISFNIPRPKSEEMAGLLSDEEIAKAATDEYKDLYERKIPQAQARFEESVARLETRIAPARLGLRARLLFTGFTFLMLSATIQILVLTRAS